MKNSLALLSLVLSGCAASAREVRWEPTVCYAARGAIERIRCGRLDASDPLPQAVSVDQAGDVALVHFGPGGPRSEVVYRNGTELTGLAIGDVDPSVPGPEIYVGGYMHDEKGEQKGGAVYQIVPGPQPRVREIYTGPAYVHSIEIAGPRELLVSTYAGEVHQVELGGSDHLLYADAPGADVERPKIKDVGLLVDPAGSPRHEALVAFKTGRLLYLDLAHPEAARVVHEEQGGLSRITPDPEGGAYVTGYFGRLLHFRREGAQWRFDVLEQEGVDSGLRGAVLGRFPAGGATAHIAVFGFHKLCRALVARAGVLDPFTLYVDIDRGHTIEAADLVPGNAADELLIGGYSKRVTLLVAR
jgi:hypothetical protein